MLTGSFSGFEQPIIRFLIHYLILFISMKDKRQ